VFLYEGQTYFGRESWDVEDSELVMLPTSDISSVTTSP